MKDIKQFLFEARRKSEPVINYADEAWEDIYECLVTIFDTTSYDEEDETLLQIERYNSIYKALSEKTNYSNAIWHTILDTYEDVNDEKITKNKFLTKVKQYDQELTDVILKHYQTLIQDIKNQK